MNDKINELLARLKQIEHEFEEEVEAGRSQFRYRISQGRIVFEQGIASEHRRLKVGVIRFLRSSPIGTLVIAPFVYGLIVPLAILDVSIWIFQKVCFSVWGIFPVARSDYLVLDRHHLGYLNSIQKLNCVYCSYANGMIAYAREVAARTEQYWCPIKHAIRTKPQHERYRRFLDYGDAQDFSTRLEKLRDEVKRSDDL